MTGLMWASVEGHKEVVQTLLVKGADVNAKRSDGVTALMFAVKGGYQEIQEMLIKAGAKMSWWEWMDRRESDAVTIPHGAFTKRLFIFGACLIALMVGGLWLWRTWRARVSEPDV